MTPLILSLIARFGPYAMIAVGLALECIGVRRGWDSFGGPFALVSAPVLLTGGGYLAGRASK